jgi:amino acid transporter
MGRDGLMPFGKSLARVSPTLGTPVVAIIVTAVFSAALIFVTQVEAVLVAVTVVLIYLAYGICTTATLVARFRGWPRDRAAFSLGGLGLIINLGAVIWGAAMIINLGWYRPTPGAPAYLNLATPIFVPVIIVIGLLYYYGFQKPRSRSQATADK